METIGYISRTIIGATDLLGGFLEGVSIVNYAEAAIGKDLNGANLSYSERLEKFADGLAIAIERLPYISGGIQTTNAVTASVNFLGTYAKVITNKNGDRVFLSADGTKRISFDINNLSPHSNPHGHVEELVNGSWIKSGSIYPIDVPQYYDIPQMS